MSTHDPTQVGSQRAPVGSQQAPVGSQQAPVGSQPQKQLPPVSADPATLGLSGFALTTFFLSMINANLISEASIGIVLAVAIAYGGLAQLFAGMWEFRTGNTFGAAAFSSYGAFWISYFVLVVAFPSKITQSGIALYLIGWGIFTGYMWIASLRVSVAVSLVFLFLTATFVVLGLGHTSLTAAQTTNTTIKIGGYLGLITAFVAAYTAAAVVTNQTFGRTVLPVKPLARV